MCEEVWKKSAVNNIKNIPINYGSSTVGRVWIEILSVLYSLWLGVFDSSWTVNCNKVAVNCIVDVQVFLVFLTPIMWFYVEPQNKSLIFTGNVS